MAPMFLVSNQEMVIAGIKKGIVGSFPSLNFREKGELKPCSMNSTNSLPVTRALMP
jgi:NAD(P)H-dependent flavin oxidoreductase YrpB (nitropropane dioxygenase family)